MAVHTAWLQIIYYILLALINTMITIQASFAPEEMMTATKVWGGSVARISVVVRARSGSSGGGGRGDTVTVPYCMQLYRNVVAG